MRYRIRVVRAQVAERTVTAKDEEAAIAKVMPEVHERCGLFGLWQTTAVEIDSIEAEPIVIESLTAPKDGLPLLLSVVESVMLGSRRLISTACEKVVTLADEG